jgi:release factor glutamine methyltransferase
MLVFFFGDSPRGMKTPPAYHELLDRLRARLSPRPDKPEETPESTLNALWSVAAGRPLSAGGAALSTPEDLDEDGLARVAALVEQRLSGVPLAHLTGRQRFMDLELIAGPGALIPRAETEILGRGALAEARALADARGRIALLDVCTGAGNLAVALAVHEPRAAVFASDLSAEAVALARANAEHLGVAERVRVAEGDLFAPFRSADSPGAFDVVTCNPPYISSAKVDSMDPEISGHEPRLAFDGGAFGVAILTRLIREAPEFLKPGSSLCFEVGRGQAKAVARMLERSAAYRAVEALANHSGETRAFIART